MRRIYLLSIFFLFFLYTKAQDTTFRNGVSTDSIIVKSLKVGSPSSTLIGGNNAGAIIFGVTQGTSSIQANSKGAFAGGNAQNSTGSFGGANQGTIRADSLGSFAFGHASDTATIQASSAGAVAMGSALYSNGLIKASGNGSFASGSTSFVTGFRHLQSIMQATGGGAFVQGRVANGVSTASGSGSFVQGANLAGTMTASGAGSFVQGSAQQTGTAMIAGNTGSKVMGFATTGAQMISSGQGATVIGNAARNGHIKASGQGSLVNGWASSSTLPLDDTSRMLATSWGSVVLGGAETGAQLTSNGPGGFAMGFGRTKGKLTASTDFAAFALGAVNNSGIIEASGDGALAGGYVNGLTDSVYNSGLASLVWGQGLYNSGNNSYVFGKGIRNVMDSSFKIGFGKEMLSVINNGNVGVGKSNPSVKLDVAGAANFSGQVGIGTENPTEKLHVEGNVVATGKMMIGNISDKSKIGTHSLAVNGSAILNKVVVRTYPNWPDYVFDSDYNLRPLLAVEGFIKKYHHLPDVPSGKDVEANGVDLASNQAALLRKIEELTLYIIAQNKEIGNQNKKIELLQGRILKIEENR